MTDMVSEKRTFLQYAKEIGISLGIIACIVICDRTWENLFFWNLYDTGCLMFDAITSFHLRGWSLLKYLIPVCFVFFSIKNRKTFHFGAIVPVLLAYACLFTITLIKTPDSLWRFWDAFEAPVITILFVTLNLQREKDARRFFGVLAFFYTAAMLWNACFRAFPELYDVFFSSAGWKPQNFLSEGDNSFVHLMLSGMLYALMNAYYSKDNKLLLAYIILFCANEYLSWCATAMVAGAVMLMYFIPPVKKFVEKTDFIYFVVFSLIFAFVLIVLFDRIASIAPIRFLVSDVLHKTLDLSGRTVLWPEVFAICMLHPLFGYGMGETASFYFDAAYNHKYVHAHNAYLQTFYEGGLFTVAAVVAVFAYTSSVLKKNNNRRMAGIFKAVLFSSLIAVEADQLAWFYLFPLFLVVQISTLCVEIGDSDNEAVQ